MDHVGSLKSACWLVVGSLPFVSSSSLLLMSWSPDGGVGSFNAVVVFSCSPGFDFSCTAAGVGGESKLSASF